MYSHSAVIINTAQATHVRTVRKSLNSGLSKARHGMTTGGRRIFLQRKSCGLRHILHTYAEISLVTFSSAVLMHRIVDAVTGLF